MPNGKYHMLAAGGTPVAGVVAHREAKAPPMWLPYLRIAEVDTAVERVRGHGGRVIADLMDVTGVGRFGANWQSTYVDDYEAIDKATGLAEPNAVGVEVNDSSIPRFRSTLRLSWRQEALEGGWTLRYISSLTEQCGGGQGFAVCDDNVAGTNELDAILYHDVRVQWHVPGFSRLRISGGINNVFGTDPPECLSCSLNGYDASLYDLPGQFGYLEAAVGF